MNKKISDVVTTIVDSSSKNGIYVYAGNKDLLLLIKKNHISKRTRKSASIKMGQEETVLIV